MYDRRFNLRDESWALAQALFGFAMVMLIMVGIAGTVYRVIAPDGWIVQAFNRGVASGLLTVGVVGLLAMLAWTKRGSTLYARRSTAVEMIVLGLAGVGALFLVQLGLNHLL